MNPGRRIKKMREELGISQDKLARMLNVTPQTVYRWEKGRTIPRPELLEKMADIFQVPLDWFYKPEGQKSRPTPQSIPPDVLEAVKDPRMQALVRAMWPVIKNM